MDASMVVVRAPALVLGKGPMDTAQHSLPRTCPCLVSTRCGWTWHLTNACPSHLPTNSCLPSGWHRLLVSHCCNQAGVACGANGRMYDLLCLMVPLSSLHMLVGCVQGGENCCQPLLIGTNT